MGYGTVPFTELRDFTLVKYVRIMFRSHTTDRRGVRHVQGDLRIQGAYPLKSREAQIYIRPVHSRHLTALPNAGVGSSVLRGVSHLEATPILILYRIVWWRHGIVRRVERQGGRERKMKTLHVQVEDGVMRALRILAAERGLTLKQFVPILVAEAWKAPGNSGNGNLQGMIDQELEALLRGSQEPTQDESAWASGRSSPSRMGKVAG
jgi:hypothetical protein